MKEEELKMGQILLDKNGCRHKILGKRGKYWELSHRNIPEVMGHLWTIEEINERGNIIVPDEIKPEPPKEK